MSDLPSGPVTLLFTDIEGSTRLVQQLGARYPDVLAAHRRILRETVAASGGHEVDTQGDSFFFVFKRARDAVEAAIAGQRGIAAHAWPADGVIRVRMGLHSGEPLRTAEGYVGLDVHRAARLGDAGHGGQVLLSRAAADLVRYDLPEGVRLWDMGERQLRGIPQPERLYQLAIPGLPDTFPPLKTREPRPNNLPQQDRGALIGREREAAALRERLRQPDTGLLTIVGPGGAGKTRLALRLAADMLDSFAHGAFFVRLAPISAVADVPADLLVAGIAATLGVREGDSRPLLERLKDFLRDRQVMLVLDNFEHLLASASIVDELLVTCPRLRVVVTSRAALHVRGEHLFPVPPLELPPEDDGSPAPRGGPRDAQRTAASSPSRTRHSLADVEAPAVQLFLRRAQAVRPDLSPAGDTAHLIARICARVEGSPLAIELAAARVRQLPLRTILARLERRLALPATVPDVPAGQLTMRAVIAWSYHLLDPGEQTLCRRLSVFVGGCTPEMAEAVCRLATSGTEAVGDLEVDVRRCMASLVEWGLLQQEDESGGVPRYAMPSTIREFALERLVGSGEASAVRRQFVDHFLALAEETAGGPRGNEPSSWPGRLHVERDNLRAALAWSRAEAGSAAALRLAVALAPFWRLRGYLTEGRGWLDGALTLPVATDARELGARARALAAAGSLALRQGDTGTAHARLEESVALWRMLGEMRGLAAALETLAAVAAYVCRYPAARQAAEEAATSGRTAGDTWTVAAALYQLGYAALGEHNYLAARARFEESLALYRELEDTSSIALPLAYLGIVLALQGDGAAGRGLLEEGLALARQAEDEPIAALALGSLARLSWLENDHAGATARAEEWLALSRGLGDRHSTARALMLLGLAVLGRGHEERACARLTESLLLCRELESGLTAAGCLSGFATMAATSGRTRRAACLLGAAHALLATSAPTMSPADRIDHDRLTATVRAGSGAGTDWSAWAEGRAMTLDAAIAHALERD